MPRNRCAVVLQPVSDGAHASWKPLLGKIAMLIKFRCFLSYAAKEDIVLQPMQRIENGLQSGLIGRELARLVDIDV